MAIWDNLGDDIVWAAKTIIDTSYDSPGNRVEEIEEEYSNVVNVETLVRRTVRTFNY